MAILMTNIASVSNQHPFNALRDKNQTTHASTFLPGESFERCKQVFGDETDLAVLQEVKNYIKSTVLHMQYERVAMVNGPICLRICFEMVLGRSTELKYLPNFNSPTHSLA